MTNTPSHVDVPADSASAEPLATPIEGEGARPARARRWCWHGSRRLSIPLATAIGKRTDAASTSEGAPWRMTPGGKGAGEPDNISDPTQDSRHGKYTTPAFSAHPDLSLAGTDGQFHRASRHWRCVGHWYRCRCVWPAEVGRRRGKLQRVSPRRRQPDWHAVDAGLELGAVLSFVQRHTAPGSRRWRGV